MARRVRDTNLETRNGRRALKISTKPYWRALDKGLHLGYRRRATGGSWIVRRFTEAGRYSESKIGLADDFQDADDIKTLDYGQALKKAREWSESEVRIEAGMEEKTDGAYTVNVAMKNYMAHYGKEGKSVKTTQTNIDAHIIPTLGPTEVGKLSTKKISDWHLKLAEAPARLRSKKTGKKLNIRQTSADPDAKRRRRATANRVMTILKAALNHAWKHGKVASDTAWRKVKPFRGVDAPVVRYLTQDQCKRLVNACPTDLRRMVQAALFTGCRYGELALLKAGDFNPDAKTLAIRTSKSGRPRHVVLTNEAKKFFDMVTINKADGDLLFAHDNKTPWGKSHQSRPLAEACKKAKISPAISFHILRHTHGSLLAMEGTPMPVIARQLGHADTRMTEKHYAHLSPDYVADTIRENFPKLGIAEKNNIVLINKK